MAESTVAESVGVESVQAIPFRTYFGRMTAGGCAQCRFNTGDGQ